VSEVNFELARGEAALIHKIVLRAEFLSRELGHEPPSRLELSMDLAMCHVNSCPLQLDELLVARDSDFAHDVFGIRRHLDRAGGRLRDGFTPRFASPAPAVQGAS